jgi:FlaA1/EpsC-like NDP-sugar epimerase
MNILEISKKIVNRESSLFDPDILKNHNVLSEEIDGQNVLVIGGAGSIGSSFIRSILRFNPKKIVVVDVNENGLTELIRGLRSSKNQNFPDEIITYPVSFGSETFYKLFMHHGPFHIVANFAAHKHVRSEKDIFSIEALIKNNLIDAKRLLDHLIENKPKHFFCVSTDKAANPVNVMGASKKLMEDLIFSYSDYFKVSTARFANVLFSNGSLLEGFLMRIQNQQPIACPNDVTRFFVTQEEAGQICMLSCILGKNNEIFFPKLNPKNDLINFKDILPVVLSEFNLQPIYFKNEQKAVEFNIEKNNINYPVNLFTTDTSGEKLYEEFYTDSETVDLKTYNSLGIITIKKRNLVEKQNELINSINKLFSRSNLMKSDIIEWLNSYIPEFQHIETGIKLDNKM